MISRLRRALLPATGDSSVSFLPSAILLLASLSCAPRRAADARPDIVLVVVDTLRADHLGAYGYSRPTSPNIDAFARRSALFESAWAGAPWTLPSVMSIMTGRYPSSHRVENDGLRLAPEVPTLAETLAGAGYATAAFVSHIYVDRPFGFERGFAAFEDFGMSRPGYRLEAGLEPTADRVTDAALGWLSAREARPSFLFVHYFDPHWPYAPPAAYRDLFRNDYRGPLDATYDSISKFQDPARPLPEDYRRFLLDRYDGEIRFVDDQVGRLLEGLRRSGRAERTWVILTADHGEEFKEHGSMGHGRQLYEEVVRVPLIVGRPAEVGGGAAAGRRVVEPVSGVDLFPTIDALAGTAPPAGLQGRGFAAFLAPKEEAAREPEGTRPLVSETVRLNAYRKAVREGRLKLIRIMDENRTELYDLLADPAERRDLSEERSDDRRRLLRALFSEVDLLSGGWNMTWSGDGRKHRFQGQVRTSGILRTVVPLFPDRGKYVVEKGTTLSFTDADQAGESGLCFTVAPYESSVTFYLMIDGRPLVERVFLGGQKAQPHQMPFRLLGNAQGETPFVRPPHAAGRDLGFFLWRNRPARPDQEITLDDEIRERLRSLGYID